jgi:CheY-like chemotaxis protein
MIRSCLTTPYSASGGECMKTILLVDDNTFILDILSLAITTMERHAAIRTARNGRDAVGILKNSRVDLILTDLNMPVMDGYHLVEYRNRHCPQVPVLVMTAEMSPDVMQRLEVLGITGCLEKPFEVEALTLLLLDTLNAPHHLPVPAESGVWPADRRRTLQTSSGKHHSVPKRRSPQSECYT